MRARVLPYRPVDRAGVDQWNSEYASGELAHYAELDEMAHYMVIVGYLQWLGGSLDILDYGCGEGLLRRYIATTEFSRYVGVDAAPNAIELARALEDERTSFVLTDRPSPELGEFDVAVLNEVMYCVPQPAALLDGVASRVKPGGHVIASNWRHPGDIALRRMLDERFEPIDSVDVRSSIGPRSSARGSRLTLHRMR